MTTPAHSPLPEKMDEGPPVKTRRGMLAFYMSTGVAVALLVAGYFAWTPLRVRYWEWRMRDFIESGADASNLAVRSGVNIPSNTMVMGDRKTGAFRKLLEIGPPARPAFGRTIRSLSPSRRAEFVFLLGAMGPKWMLPVIAESVKDKDHAVAVEAIDVFERLSGKSFFPKGKRRSDEKRPLATRKIESSELPEARNKCLEWWEREGRTKYGRGEE